MAKIERLSTTAPQASKGTTLGVTVFQNHATGRLGFKDKNGALLVLQDNNGTINADTISEVTSGSGVTIDGVLLKDGVVTTTGPNVKSVDPAITALGTDDTDGYPLTEEINVITGGAANTGVELPTAVVGTVVTVVNLTASAKIIYPNASDQIDDLTVTTGGVTIQPEDVVTFYSYTTALWQSDFESVDSYNAMSVNNALTTGASLAVTNTGAYTGTGIVAITADSLTTGAGIFASFDGLTSGEGVNLTSSGVVVDGGSIFRITASGLSTGGASNGAAFDIASTTQVAGSVAKITSAITTGVGLDIVVNDLISGQGLSVNSTSTTITSGAIAYVLGSGDWDDALGAGLRVTTQQTTGTSLDVLADTATDGIGISVSADALTSGKALSVISESTDLTTGGNVVYIEANQDFNDAGAQVVEIESQHTTGTGLQLTMDAVTDGFGQVISAAALTTGNALDISVNASATGAAIRLAGGSGIEHTSQMKMISATPTVGTGCDGALVAEWACYGRHGGSTTTGIIKSELYIDLTNLVSSTTLNDIIGEDDAANAHFGQITSAIHGTIFGMEIECLETPAGGDADIDFNVGTDGTDAEDVDVTGITGYVQLLAKGTTWAIEDRKTVVAALPAANDYLILSVGAGGTAAAYTAGKFKITFYGL